VLITNEIFTAFLYCETKSYLRSLGNIGHQSEYIEWEQSRYEDFRKKCIENLRSNGGEDKYIFDRVLRAQELLSRPHALERFVNNAGKKRDDLSPIRFVSNEKPTKYDKISLAFDALVLSKDSGKMPLYGKLIYGSSQRVLKVKLDGVIGVTRDVIGKIYVQQANPASPQVILNKHCPVCEYQAQCRQTAIEKDDLTLLSRLTEKERKQQHKKGIFTVTQLSYTFRARRKPKRLASKPEKYSHALKALAIREHKI
jgi:predicted RecB family nuclease